MAANWIWGRGRPLRWLENTGSEEITNRYKQRSRFLGRKMMYGSLGHVEFNHQRDFPVKVFRIPLDARIWARDLKVGIIAIQAVVHWGPWENVRCEEEGAKRGP